MHSISDFIDEYIGSEYFLLSQCRADNSGEILHLFFKNLNDEFSFETVKRALNHIGRLQLSLETRKNAPDLVISYLHFTGSTGRDPRALDLIEYVEGSKDRYLSSFREDGTIRGETYSKPCAPVKRNDPCPCGSNKKFKKCCGPALL
ncbi:SEC-C metal-binding domain-containing protein [Chitinispirillales bacterium ANBcel5]|uniref:SEC-C metal-binding domain-containing protein n=1 Tax=Cellulosispirillum alkaliphilum TaxID=3039283 RepID=UPI002A54DDB5|nr:SEC-C metal-binding domain-containing protein [Chitinispirillales bacterium ANBcel5]